jgi:glycosyltransferase involved in cell wall biosynthesis
MKTIETASIAVIIPCFRVKEKVLDVIRAVPPKVAAIYVVDDACPEQSGNFVRQHCHDSRVKVLLQSENSGVGGATLRGFQEAFRDGHEIFVKIDGDGQMDPRFLPAIVNPILLGDADYAKGNRFYSPQALRSMPTIRKLGNAGISFFSKLATGYWQMMDPTNGYIAIHRNLFPLLETEKISKRFFFENDLLFRLSLLRAVVADVPMDAVYGDEKSNLNVWHALFSFPGRFFARAMKRIAYRYFIRDFNPASLCLVLGSLLLLIGGCFGGEKWLRSLETGAFASSGTVMLSALPILVGFQMLLFFVLYDMVTAPSTPIAHKLNAVADAWKNKV